MPRPSKKTPTAEVQLPNGAKEVTFQVESKVSSIHINTNANNMKPSDFIQSPTPTRRCTGRQRRATTRITEDATADIPITPAQGTRNDRHQGDPAPAAAPAIASALPANIPSAVPAADLPNVNDVAPEPIPTPVRDEAANPFLTGPQPDIPIENLSSPASTERRFYIATPSTAARTPHCPQAGRHSTIRVRPHSPLDGPAGHKQRHTASDVWTFFEEMAGKNCCVFCKYV